MSASARKRFGCDNTSAPPEDLKTYLDGIESRLAARLELLTRHSRWRDLPRISATSIYSFRYRKRLPEEIAQTATGKKEWVIEPACRAKYRFRLAGPNRIVPRPDQIAIKIPDATPEIIAFYVLTDEQALLASAGKGRQRPARDGPNQAGPRLLRREVPVAHLSCDLRAVHERRGEYHRHI